MNLIYYNQRFKIQKMLKCQKIATNMGINLGKITVDKKMLSTLTVIFSQI